MLNTKSAVRCGTCGELTILRIIGEGGWGDPSDVNEVLHCSINALHSVSPEVSIFDLDTANSPSELSAMVERASGAVLREFLVKKLKDSDGLFVIFKAGTFC